MQSVLLSGILKFIPALQATAENPLMNNVPQQSQLLGWKKASKKVKNLL